MEHNFSQFFSSQYTPFIVIGIYFAFRFYKSLMLKKKLPSLINQGAQLIDVRGQGEFLSGNAPGSINIPLQELERRLGEIKRDLPVIVACASGGRSGMAKFILKKNGYTRVINAGSWTNLRRS